MRSAPTLNSWMMPRSSVAMIEKFALVRIAFCNAPALSRAFCTRAFGLVRVSTIGLCTVDGSKLSVCALVHSRGSLSGAPEPAQRWHPLCPGAPNAPVFGDSLRDREENRISSHRKPASCRIAVPGRPALVAALCLLAAAGCATLPDAGLLGERYAVQAAQFQNAQGALSAKRSAAIVAGLKRGSGDLDILDKQIALEQEIVGSALVVGN